MEAISLLQTEGTISAARAVQLYIWAFQLYFKIELGKTCPLTTTPPLPSAGNVLLIWSPLFFFFRALTEHFSTGIPSHPEHEGMIKIFPIPVFFLKRRLMSSTCPHSTLCKQSTRWTHGGNFGGKNLNILCTINICLFINSLVRIKELY